MPDMREANAQAYAWRNDLNASTETKVMLEAAVTTIDGRFWGTQLDPEASKYLALLEGDLEDMRTALDLYNEANRIIRATLVRADEADGPGWTAESRHQMRLASYHSKNFIVSMARFALMLKRCLDAKADAKRQLFPPEIYAVIKLARAKREAFFSAYKTVRDDIEHLDERVAQNQQFMTRINDTFMAVPANRVDVTEAAYEQARRALEEVVLAIRLPVAERVARKIRSNFVSVLAARLQELQQPL